MASNSDDLLFSPLVFHPNTNADRIEQKRLTRADKMNVTIPFEPGTTAKQLAERAAEKSHVRLSEGRLIGGGPGGKSFSFILRADVKSHLWKRISTNGRTVPGRVCWHGHREFLTNLFEDTPHAYVRTMLANYGGRTEFETTYPSTYVKPGWNVRAAADVRCICKEVERVFGSTEDDTQIYYGMLYGQLWRECKECSDLMSSLDRQFFHPASYNGVCQRSKPFHTRNNWDFTRLFTVD